MVWWGLAALFVLAALCDYLSVLWHQLREGKRTYAMALVSIALEGLHWLPVWFAIRTEDWRVMIVSMAGSALGVIVGMRRV